MAAHHVEAPEQVVTPGEELWVKIIDIDLERRRISLSIKQAAEGGVVAAEYQDQFGEHAYDEHGNYIGPETPIEGAEGLEAPVGGRPPVVAGPADAVEPVAEPVDPADVAEPVTAEAAAEAVEEPAEAVGVDDALEAAAGDEV